MFCSFEKNKAPIGTKLEKRLKMYQIKNAAVSMRFNESQSYQ